MVYIIQPTSDDLVHSFKGTTWKNHKYVTKTGNPPRYVYKDDLARRREKLKLEVKRNKANNADAKREYTKLMKLVDAEQKYADMVRPLTAKIQKGSLNKYLEFMDYLKNNTHLLDAKIAKQQAKLDIENQARDAAARDLAKTREIKEGQALANYDRIQTFTAAQNKAKEKAEQGKREKEEKKKEHQSNFLSRITLKR